MSRVSLLLLCAFTLTLSIACTPSRDNANTTATSSVTPPPVQQLSAAQTPQKILDQKAARGEQEQAEPVIKIVSPANNSVVQGSTVQVRLELSGDLKGYKPGKDPATGEGNHIHVILDNNPYEAYYELNAPFELQNVTSGKHVLRVFASRPWHESYKNEGSFQMVTFTVNGGSDASKPTTTGTGQVMANNNSAGPSTQEELDPSKPLLTYSRPKGDYKGDEADPIMIDFWLTNAKLKGDGGEYRVRYIIDDAEPGFIDKWEPLWLKGWLSGKHTVRLELIGPDGWPSKNGGFNVTTREINVSK